VDIPQRPLALFLRALEVNSPLTDADCEAVLALPHRMRTLEPATYLTREGDLPDQCGIINSGFAYRQKHTGDGLRQIIALLIPGDAVDLQHLFLETADHSVQMLSRGDVAFIARKDLRELALSHPNVGLAMMVNIQIEASIFREWVLNVGRRDARGRLAHVLCEFALRMNRQSLSGIDGCELPITQEQLGDVLGLTTVHTARTLKVLESEGLITRQRRTITFPSWERLREVADFNQRYLHLDQQDLCVLP
jgi:CRP-like cAMP-binding protein